MLTQNEKSQIFTILFTKLWDVRWHIGCPTFRTSWQSSCSCRWIGIRYGFHTSIYWWWILIHSNKASILWVWTNNQEDRVRNLQMIQNSFLIILLVSPFARRWENLGNFFVGPHAAKEKKIRHNVSWISCLQRMGKQKRGDLRYPWPAIDIVHRDDLG